MDILIEKRITTGAVSNLELFLTFILQTVLNSLKFLGNDVIELVKSFSMSHEYTVSVNSIISRKNKVNEFISYKRRR